MVENEEKILKKLKEMTKYFKHDDVQLTSIIYSDLVTDAENPNDECTCTPDKRAYGDVGELRQIYPKNVLNPFLFSETMNTYTTAADEDQRKPFRKFSAARFEAEYDFCMRWKADRKFKAAKVIPFQTNFFSCARLMFRGRNWVLDCANYEGQYDYCGWLPSNPSTPKKEKEVIDLKRHEIMSDSSIDLNNRYTAGKQSIHSSDTCYGLQSILSDESELTKNPIDQRIYDIMGQTNTRNTVQESLNSQTINKPTSETPTTEILTAPIVGNCTKMTTDDKITKSSSLDNLFFDLVELDQLFMKQVEEANKHAELKKSESFDSFSTAKSFSNSLIFPESTGEENATSSTGIFVDSEYEENVENSRSLINYLICLTGKKLNSKLTIEVLRNWLGYK